LTDYEQTTTDYAHFERTVFSYAII